MNPVLRLLHTLRFLQPRQVYGRPLHALKRRFCSVGYPPDIPRRAARHRDELLPRVRSRITWDFVGRTVVSASHDIPWDMLRKPRMQPAGVVDPSLAAPVLPDKLWRYNLSYFDYLFRPAGFTPTEELFLILDWLARNDDEHAEPWEPYVVSRRVRNWVRWLRCPDRGGALPDATRGLLDRSLLFQLRRLARDLEHHILANHLFENYATLVIGGIHLAGSRVAAPSRGRLDAILGGGIAGLLEQIGEQILADGAHYELSPMYHLDVLHTLRQVNGAVLAARVGDRRLAPLADACRWAIPLMERWLARMSHPDGGISLFNDSVLLPAGTAAEGDDEALLPASGYFIRRWGEGDFLVMDCGDPQPAYQTGHSHCDALSYELSLSGRRLVVDGGIGSYHDPAIRQDGRGTAAHNLPCIEGVEQSEIWGGFRMGRRSRVEDRVHDPGARRMSLTVRDYRGNRFRRVLSWQGDGLTFDDTLLERVDRGAFLSLVHLHPEARVIPRDQHSATVTLAGRAVTFEASCPWETRSARHYPAFGPGVPSTLIRCQGTHRDAIRISLRRDA